MFENYIGVEAPYWWDTLQGVSYTPISTQKTSVSDLLNFSDSNPIFESSLDNFTSSATDFELNNDIKPPSSIEQSTNVEQPASSSTSNDKPAVSSKDKITIEALSKDKKEFVNKLYQTYVQVINDYNRTAINEIDPRYIIDLITHDTIESAWGNHALGFNLGGIKATQQQIKNGVPYISANTFEYINGKKVHIRDNFRKFYSLKEYVKFKIKMLTEGRYAKAGVFHGDFIHTLKVAGYFTAPESIYKNMFNGRKKQVEKLLQ